MKRRRGLGSASARIQPAEDQQPAHAAPKGERARELLGFIRTEVQRTGVFPDSAAMMLAMDWKSSASVDDALLRLIAGGFITRQVAARKGMRRVFAYRLVELRSAERKTTISRRQRKFV